MSKSQSREVFALDNASVVTEGLSVFSAVTGQELFKERQD